MRRRYQRPASGFFPADALAPLARMLALMIVLGLIYSWAEKPQTWRWLADNSAESLAAPAASTDASLAPPSAGSPATSDAALPATSTAPAKGPGNEKQSAVPRPRVPPEVIVPGPNDRDEQEAAAGQKLFEAVSDRAPLEKIEMPAYWRCLKWARSQSFAELESRAVGRVLYTQLFEQPDRYRGKLLKLRLHIQRVVDWDAAQNSAGVKRVYEAWGWTDDSKSYPYVVVFSELPPGLQLGDNLKEEGIFAGYFLKTMAYKAFNRNQSAPLLIGKLQQTAFKPSPHVVVANHREWLWIGAVGIPLILLMLSSFWLRLRRPRTPVLPRVGGTDEAQIENWLRGESASGPYDEPRDFSDRPAL